jgi:hypothetical protein
LHFDTNTGNKENIKMSAKLSDDLKITFRTSTEYKLIATVKECGQTLHDATSYYTRSEMSRINPPIPGITNQHSQGC